MLVGRSALAKKVVRFDKISVITNHLSTSADGLWQLDKFWPKQTNLQTYRQKNFSQVKTRQNHLNRQNFVYPVIHMS